MHIKTPYFPIEIEWLLLIVLILAIFCSPLQKIMGDFFICYLFIVFHECGHMFVASFFSRQVELFKVSLAGVSIVFEEPKYVTEKKKIKLKTKYVQNICVFLAGPLSNVFLAIIFYGNNTIFEINLFLCMLNLIPIFPLDGYNILKYLFLLIRLKRR
ncbi:MAG: M50 family metallopeptidase [Clostridia bacterium]